MLSLSSLVRLKEIFISTYICHPSMANNEFSGPVVTTLWQKRLEKKKPYYTFRFFLFLRLLGYYLFKSKLKAFTKKCIAGM